MGTVYLGHHQHLPREVVVKSILFGAYSPSAQLHLKSRFRREAYIQSQLDHPNIVRVYEFFALNDNYYLVMEYVPGMSLKQLLSKQGVLTPGQAVFLCKQALAALNYAHNFSYVDESESRHRGIIHRDIKPANLLLDQQGRLKITDFGIVKATGDEDLTQSGFQPGTVEYMSPEQLLGLNVDERTDIYCLGVTFYEMLTGKLPFPRSATGSDWEVRKGHIELDPPPVQDLRPGIHPILAEIVMRSLRKNPNERPQTAAEFLEALQNYEQISSSGKVTQPAFTISTNPDQAPSLYSRSTFLGSSSPSQKDPLEGAITIPIAPVPESSEGPATEIIPEDEAEEVYTYRPKRQVLISVPSGPPQRRWSLAFAVVCILLLGMAAGVYLFSGQRQNKIEQTSAATNFQTITPAPATDATPSPQVMHKTKPVMPAPDNALLKQARAAEQRESYPEAIQKYEDFLRRYPTASEARSIADKLVLLRQFQGLMTAAKTAMEMRRFGVARQNYTEALKLRPESETAKAGLTEAESRIRVSPINQRQVRPLPDGERIRRLQPDPVRPSGVWRKMHRPAPNQRPFE